MWVRTKSRYLASLILLLDGTGTDSEQRSDTVCRYDSTSNNGGSRPRSMSISSPLQSPTGSLQSPPGLLMSPTLGSASSLLSCSSFQEKSWPSSLWLSNLNGGGNELWTGSFADFGLPWQDVQILPDYDQWLSDVQAVPPSSALTLQHQHSKSNEAVSTILSKHRSTFTDWQTLHRIFRIFLGVRSSQAADACCW